MTAFSTRDLNAVWADKPGDWFAVGDGGKIWQNRGAGWTPMASPRSDDLFDVLGSDSAYVWAVGDVARHRDPRTGERVRIEHFVVAERQGQAAARAMLGDERPYVDVPFFWSQHYDVSFSCVGHAARWDHIDTRGSLEARDFAAFYSKSGRVLAVVTVGRDRLGLLAEAAIERSDAEALAALRDEAS